MQIGLTKVGGKDITERQSKSNPPDKWFGPFLLRRFFLCLLKLFRDGSSKPPFAQTRLSKGGETVLGQSSRISKVRE